MPDTPSPLAEAVLTDRDRLYQDDVDQAQAERAVSPGLPPLAPVQVPPLTADEERLCSAIRRKQTAHLGLLKLLVNQNSGSRNPAGIAAVLDLLTPRYQALGLDVEDHPAGAASGSDTPVGPHRVFRRSGEAGPRVLLIGHVDTVFEPGCGFERYTDDGERGHGPGCADMKGGIVVMLAALEGLAEVGLLASHPLTVLHNGDEEISSRGSRPLIVEEAAGADVGLVFEPGRADPWGAVTLARKGTGSFVLTVHGRAAHSGNRFVDGCSAVDDLARKVVALGRLTDLRKGRTLNVGILRTGPGAKRNRVADLAVAEFDMRVTDPADADTVVAAVKAIAGQSLVHNPWTHERTTCDLVGGLAREPMPCTDQRATFYRQLAGLAARLEVPIDALSVGGGSDANIAAAQGLLVVDGLGPIGSGLHTEQEWVDLASVGDRACLTAVLLHRIWTGALPLNGA